MFLLISVRFRDASNYRGKENWFVLPSVMVIVDFVFTVNNNFHVITTL